MKKVLRATTETIHIDRLRNDAHVGFTLNDGEKGYVVSLPSGELWGSRITNHNTVKNSACSGFGSNSHYDIKDAIPYHAVDIYVFDTRHELYQWLATD